MIRSVAFNNFSASAIEIPGIVDGMYRSDSSSSGGMNSEPNFKKTGTVASTIANALPILQRLSTRSVLIVTDGYHAPRARLIASRLGLEPQTTSPAPTGLRWGQWLRYVLREIPAYFVALIMPQR